MAQGLDPFGGFEPVFLSHRGEALHISHHLAVLDAGRPPTLIKLPCLKVAEIQYGSEAVRT
jgi:hypothetical protein